MGAVPADFGLLARKSSKRPRAGVWDKLKTGFQARDRSEAGPLKYPQTVWGFSARTDLDGRNPRHEWQPVGRWRQRHPDQGPQGQGIGWRHAQARHLGQEHPPHRRSRRNRSQCRKGPGLGSAHRVCQKGLSRLGFGRLHPPFLILTAGSISPCSSECLNLGGQQRARGDAVPARRPK